MLRKDAFITNRENKMKKATKEATIVPILDHNLDFPVFDTAAAFVDYLTDYPELAQRNKAYFTLKDAQENQHLKKRCMLTLLHAPKPSAKPFLMLKKRCSKL